MKYKSGNYGKYTSMNPLRRMLVKGFQKRLLEIVRSLNPKSILDAGCGEGFNTSIISNTMKDADVEIMGIDINEEAISVAKENVPSVSFDKGSVYNLPFDDGRFDLVLLNEVLEHLPDPSRAFDEAFRVSSEYLVLSVPNEPFFRLGNFIFLKNIRRFGSPSDHLQHWSKRAFIKFLSSKGELLRVESPFPWTLVLMQKKNA